MSIRFSPVMLFPVQPSVARSTISCGGEVTSEEVDILSAVDADQPLAYAVLVPISARFKSVSELGQSEEASLLY